MSPSLQLVLPGGAIALFPSDEPPHERRTDEKGDAAVDEQHTTLILWRKRDAVAVDALLQRLHRVEHAHGEGAAGRRVSSPGARGGKREQLRWSRSSRSRRIVHARTNEKHWGRRKDEGEADDRTDANWKLAKSEARREQKSK